MSINRNLRPAGTNGSETGSALIEMGIAAPVLFLILFGLIQFGLIFAAQLSIRNAASIAARFSILGVDPAADPSYSTGPDQAEVIQTAKDAIQTFLDPTQLSGTLSTVALTSGDNARQVQLNYNFPLMFSYVLPGNGGTIQLTANATMR